MACSRVVLASVLSVPVLMATALLRAEEVGLRLRPGAGEGEVVVAGTGSAGGSHRVEFSDGLEDWWPVFAIRGVPSWEWTWGEWNERRTGFFRVVDAVPPVVVGHPSWKDRLTLPGDPFLSDPVGGTGQPFAPVELRWVKFALLMDELPRVYFQDSRTYPFHFDFAVQRLAPFVGMGREAFEAVSRHRAGQEVVLGAVLWAPGRGEYGIQFVGQDEYPREMLRFLYETVDGRIGKPEGAKGFYMPTTEQAGAARQDGDYLARHGITVASPERWIGGSACYAPGWALGRLQFVAAGEIEAAALDGRLRATDILLTDGVPAEVPLLAGIITLTPTTPNSHVAILAQSYGIPFVYVREPAEHERLFSLVGREVVLRTQGYSCEQIAVFETEGLDPAYRQEILALKEPLPLEIVPMARRGSIAVADLTRAVPEDLRFIGGKAANYGFLRREIPAHAPVAMAFTFDLWNAYLDQVVAGGRTLRAEIESRLAGLRWPEDLVALDRVLRGIRDLIEDEADFTAGQRSAILASLAGFDPRRKIRFRSSTNVEDSGVFVGAGLYDSFSGCVADDTDGDEAGPSHCDPPEAKERGVFRAMRKVYASFYNLNAFIERLRHGVDEGKVGMAMLVHHSFPDELEAANGVAVSRTAGANFLYTTMVTQVGAESVTNPGGGSIPEVVEVERYRPQPGNAALYHIQRSNRLLLGVETVMNWERDYQDFGDLFFKLVDAWRARYPAASGARLEFEYKKLTDGGLVVKQVREVPEAPGRPAPALAVVNSPVRLKVFQGERGDVFSNHRLKSLWRMSSAGRWVDPANPLGTLLVSGELEHVPNGAVVVRSGVPAQWPGFVNDVVREFGNTFGRDRWTGDSEGGATSYELRVMMPSGTGYRSDPIHTPADFELWYEASYQNPLPAIDWQGELGTTRRDFVVLTGGGPDDPLPTGSVLVERSFTSGKGAGLRTSFYWPPPPTGIVAGYTAPLEKWVGTTVTGLTAQPIHLVGYFSQTYRPGHHNFTEEFLFEPRLEEGIPASVRSELEARNIRLIYFATSGGPLDGLKAIGYDGTVRDL